MLVSGSVFILTSFASYRSLDLPAGDMSDYGRLQLNFPWPKLFTLHGLLSWQSQGSYPGYTYLEHYQAKQCWVTLSQCSATHVSMLICYHQKYLVAWVISKRASKDLRTDHGFSGDFQTFGLLPRMDGLQPLGCQGMWLGWFLLSSLHGDCVAFWTSEEETLLMSISLKTGRVTSPGVFSWK